MVRKKMGAHRATTHDTPPQVELTLLPTQPTRDERNGDAERHDEKDVILQIEEQRILIRHHRVDGCINGGTGRRDEAEEHGSDEREVFPHDLRCPRKPARCSVQCWPTSFGRPAALAVQQRKTSTPFGARQVTPKP